MCHFLFGGSIGPGNIHVLFGLPPASAFKAEAQQIAPGILESNPCERNRMVSGWFQGNQVCVTLTHITLHIAHSHCTPVLHFALYSPRYFFIFIVYIFVSYILCFLVLMCSTFLLCSTFFVFLCFYVMCSTFTPEKIIFWFWFWFQFWRMNSFWETVGSIQPACR